MSTTVGGTLKSNRSAGAGWLTYATLMLGIAGTFNVIDGIVALSRSRFYAGGATFVFSDLRTWGWIVLGLGIVEIGAALTVATGSQLGRWAGIAAASLSGIGQLAFLHAYPIWSLAAFVMDVLIVYALATYGGARARASAL